jgi:hypothetical protein
MEVANHYTLNLPFLYCICSWPFASSSLSKVVCCMLKMFMWDSIHMFLTYSLIYITGKIIYIFVHAAVFCVACMILQDITHVRVALVILVFLCTEH